MSEETFQITITVAVVLAYLSMIVQGLVALALYRSSRSMAARISPILVRIKAVLVNEKDSIRRVEIVIDKTLIVVDILERLAPRFQTLGARVEAVGARAMQLDVPVTELKRSARLVETTTHFMFLETRPRVASIGAEASALGKSVGAQLRRLSGVFREAIAHFDNLREVVISK
jgi:hypothetical protein